MSTPIPATLSNLAALKAQADFASGMVHLHLKKWLALHRRLFLLKQCAQHSIYAELPLRGNMAALKHCVCKPLRKSLQAVIAVQRGMAVAENGMREWVRREKGLHWRFGDVAA